MKRKITSRDWKATWPQTVLSIVALLFTVLVGFGVITPEQSAEAQPIITSTIGAIATVIAGISALIGIFFKTETPA